MVVPASPLRHGRDHLGTRRSRDVRWTEKRPTRPPRARASPCAASVRTPRFLRHRGYIRPSEKPKSSGEQHLRETLCCMLSQSPFSRTKTFFPFFVCVSVHQKASPSQKAASSRLLWRRPSPLAYTLRLAQRRHAEIEQNGARADPTTVRGVRFPPLAEPSRRRSPPRRLRVARSRVAPLDFSRRRRQRLTGAPRLPRDRRAIFPEALKSLKEADPDVYALVQKEKLRQMCVQAPTRTNATRSRAIDAMSSCHTTDFPDFPNNLATGMWHSTERRLTAVLTYSSSRAPTAEASSSSRARTSRPRP